MSRFLGTLSNSLRENISHVASAAVEATSGGPEPVFDRMQVIVVCLVFLFCQWGRGGGEEVK